MIGPSRYGDPQISSTAIRLISKKLASWLPMPNPAGAEFFVYTFEAAAEGEARIRFPVEGQQLRTTPPGGPPFAGTIRVRKS
jgi:hypothetical protein